MPKKVIQISNKIKMQFKNSKKKSTEKNRMALFSFKTIDCY